MSRAAKFFQVYRLYRRHHGTIYAASIFAGTILRIGRDGSTSAAAVPFPTDVEIGHGMIVVGSMPLTGGPGAVYRVAPSAFVPVP